MAAGDRWYGTAMLGSSPATPGDIGSFPITIIRHDDDVAKTATVAEASVGDTIGYEIAIEPNVTAADLVYTVTDTVPDGLTIEPDSVTGDGVVDGRTITWEVGLPTPGFAYDMVTSATDAACAVPLSGPDNSGSGGYLNLVDFGITPGPEFFEPQQIPDPTDPNNTLAMFWHDFEVAFGDDPHRGVSLASLGGTGADGGIVIDYKGVEPRPAGSTDERYDFQVFMWRSAGDGHDIIFAYDNLGDLEGLTTTVGLETRSARTPSPCSTGTPRPGCSPTASRSASTSPPQTSTRSCSATRVPVDAAAVSGSYT